MRSWRPRSASSHLAGRLAFLVFGPMLSFRMAAMYAGAMPRRMVVVMILAAAPLVLAACELAGWLLSLLGNLRMRRKESLS